MRSRFQTCARVALLALLCLWPGAAAAQSVLPLSVTTTLTTNGDRVCWDFNNRPSLTITLGGTWTGTVTPEADEDYTGTPAAIKHGVNPATNAVVENTTSNIRIAVANFGYARFCLAASAAMTGTVTFSGGRGFGVSAPATLEGDVMIDVSTLATHAKQDTIITALASLLTGPLTVSTHAVTGPLTDAQLRATAVPISGALTDAQLRATAVPISGALTDAQLRATAVPISGTVTANAGTNLNTAALLTTSAFTTVFGSATVLGAAGTPATPVLTVQGDPLGSVLPVSSGDVVDKLDDLFGSPANPASQGAGVADAPFGLPGFFHAFDLDGVAPTGGVQVVAEDQLIRPKCSLQGSCFVVLTNETLTTDIGALLGLTVINHDATDAAPTVGIGVRAIDHGTNPTAVAAGERTVWFANRGGVPFIMGGHPNIVSKTATVLAADGAQTGTALLDISAGTKIIVTRANLRCSADNSVNPDFRLLFDTDATPPAASTTGVTGEIDAGYDVIAGGGFSGGSGSGILGIGGDGEDLRYHLGAPTSGACTVSVSYYTVPA